MISIHLGFYYTVTPIHIQPRLQPSFSRCLFKQSFDHLISDPSCFWKPRSKICLNLLKFLAVAVEVTKTHAITPILLSLDILDDMQSFRLTRAPNVNSRSSARKVVSSIATCIASSSRSGLRNRYSAIPSQRRNNYNSEKIKGIIQYGLQESSKSYVRTEQYPVETNNQPLLAD
jgi:hypothetical protein